MNRETNREMLRDKEVESKDITKVVQRDCFTMSCSPRLTHTRPVIHTSICSINDFLCLLYTPQARRVAKVVIVFTGYLTIVHGAASI